MRKLVILLAVCAFFAGTKNVIALVEDNILLQERIIRLHVVAQSDDGVDQNIKLCVKDAIVSYLQEHIPSDIDIAGAKRYLSEHLEALEDVANGAIDAAGGTESARVTMTKEAFPRRDYETFSLPSGVYDSLRVTIGEGQGRNWWCVIFPSLCAGATTEEYKDLAAGAGFSEGLVSATAGETGYEIRFFLLDCIGKLENFFHFR